MTFKVDWQVGQSGHAAEHNQIGLALNQVVYSANYPTLQDAIDTAASLTRPLIIEPKGHILSTPLLLDNLNGIHVFAYGATFVSSGNMAALLDMRDCIYSSWTGGHFQVNNGHVVDNAVYIHRENTRSSQCIFRDIHIQGDYSTGLRIGRLGDNLQCDDMTFSNTTLSGTGKPGQTGVYCGSNQYGNNLNHHFYKLASVDHETNVAIKLTNAYITGGEFGHAAVDLDVDAVSFVCRNVRSESSKRFLQSLGYSSYLTQVTIEDVSWTGEQIAADGEWIQYYHAGNLRLNNVSISEPVYLPIIHVQGGAPLRVSINGLATPATAQGAFLLGTNASVKGDYIQTDAIGQIPIGITTL